MHVAVLRSGKMYFILKCINKYDGLMDRQMGRYVIKQGQ